MRLGAEMRNALGSITQGSYYFCVSWIPDFLFLRRAHYHLLDEETIYGASMEGLDYYSEMPRVRGFC
jgi:hypothetical protein